MSCIIVEVEVLELFYVRSPIPRAYEDTRKTSSAKNSWDSARPRGINRCCRFDINNGKATNVYSMPLYIFTKKAKRHLIQGPSRLPTEVYPYIFCHLRDSTSTLCILRIVSVTFKREVEPFIRIVADTPCGNLIRQIRYLRSICKYKGITRLIRSFRFTGVDVPSLLLLQRECWERLREALGYMENLEYLILSGMSPSFNLFDRCKFHKLTTAKINYEGYTYREPYQHSLRFLTSLPSYVRFICTPGGSNPVFKIG